MTKIKVNINGKVIILDKWPFIWPFTGQLGDGFGPRAKHPITGKPAFHYGLDIGTAKDFGKEIVASGAGNVVRVGMEGGYGNNVVIYHGKNRGHTMHTRYAHLSNFGVFSPYRDKRGNLIIDRVKKGEVIGLIGSTGWSTEAHIHFEIMVDGFPIDPLYFLPMEGLPHE